LFVFVLFVFVLFVLFVLVLFIYCFVCLQVAGAGVGFAITKATEGTTYKDAYFAANWKGMKSSGIKVRGAYHFGHPSTDAAAQAKYFVEFVGPLEVFQLEIFFDYF